MFGTILFVILLFVGLGVFFMGPRASLTDEGGTIARIAGAVITLLAIVMLFFMVTTIVDDGKVGVTKSFGEYGAETLEPGVHIVMPWEDVQQIDTRVKSYTFSANAEESISGPIAAQAKGGGNLLIEQTIQLTVDKQTADDLLREVGSEWFNTVVLPPIRSCTRDSSVGLTLEEAYTSGRGEIASNTLECVTEKVEKYGITILDVLIRDVDPGGAVKAAIDEKQKAEQDLQRASVQTRVVEEEARQESIRAFGTSQAEQIIACGGTETKTEEGETIIVPNTLCEDQFSDEYLQWLYINELSKIQGTVILPPNFDGELFVQTPQPQG